MSLAEVLISSLLLAISSSAALGVWSQATAIWQQSRTLQQSADELALMQLASHRWLTLHGSELNLLRSGLDPCLLMLLLSLLPRIRLCRCLRTSLGNGLWILISSAFGRICLF